MNWAVGLTVETVDPRTLPKEKLEEYHAFSTSLMKEDYPSFVNHVLFHDVLYIFRKRSDSSLVGLSHWRHTDLPTKSGQSIKLIIQGKLRILASFRRLSLHVWATLWYWKKIQLENPLSSVWFISIASLFNFVSMRRSISEFYIMNGKYQKPELGYLDSYLDKLVAMDHFERDPVDPCRINVFIKIPTSTLQEFPSSFYQLPEAQEFIKVNPNYADGWDLAYAYPYSFGNVLGMLARATEQTYMIPNGLSKSTVLIVFLVLFCLVLKMAFFN